MKSSKRCPKCGLINFAIDEVCKRCGAFIAETKEAPPRVPLVQCPACDATVSSQAASCPRCGHPLLIIETGSPLEVLTSDSRSRQTERRQPSMQSSMTCPQCGSDASVTFEMANASGTSIGNIGGLTYSPDTGLGGFGGKTTQQTQLAARTAPPRHPNSIVPLAVILVSLLFLSIAFIVGVTGSGAGALAILFFGGIAVVALGYWLNKDFQNDVERHARAIDSWRNSVICLRCGHAWQRRIRVLRSGLTSLGGHRVKHVIATSNAMRP